MNSTQKAGLVSAALTVAAALIVPAQAADLGGSIKDGYAAPLPVVHSSAGPCYFRADVGGSVSRDPDVKWPVSNEVFDRDRDGDGIIGSDEVHYVYEGDKVSNVEMENTWLADVGIGCGSGSRGLRGEAAFTFRGDRKIDGEPLIYRGTIIGDPVGTPNPDVDDPLHTNVQSYSLMFNGYYDLGNYGGFVPYVGAGVGVAYNIVDDVSFTQNPNLVNVIEGDKTLAFAWSVMAGVGYQISDRAILDFGYRYIDLGDATSGKVDSAHFVNPPVKIDDLGNHEFKVGLRYHFGGDRTAHYEPLK
ncbi:MAG: outer membrane beta-barrel protein [Hyphomicrobiaceae bacterium]|nr:outer membrane beta-barrel protein [Hyphomicrobiaceae bacterium]